MINNTFLSVLNHKSSKIILTAVVLVILLGTLHTTDRLPSSRGVWPSSTSLGKHKDDCHSLRSNPHHIKLPEPASPATLRSYWSFLNELFEDQRPAPSDVDLPTDDTSFFPLSEDAADYARLVHSYVLANLPAYPVRTFKGKGVIILAGARYSEYAATSLGMLRETGNRLPVEVWMKDDEEELPGWCEELAAEGMACRKLSDYMSTSFFKHSYSMKVFTMLFTSFEEFVFIDADSAPVKDPAPIFDSKLYQDKGAIIWPDYWKMNSSEWLTHVLGVSDGPTDLSEVQSAESGQVVWNKRRHWKSLLMAVYYNYWGADFYYNLINTEPHAKGWGDKDCFPMALRATGEPFYQVEHGVMTLFREGSSQGVVMLQSSPLNEETAEPMFLHANIIKWSMRELACIACEPKAHYDSHYYLDDANSDIYSHLTEGKRILSTTDMPDFDPEPMLWKSMEYTACQSAAWGSAQVCNQTRTYIHKTFGYTFKNGTNAPRVGMDTEYCVADLVATGLW